MATNPASMIPDALPNLPALIKGGTGDATLVLDGQVQYRLYHTGLNESATAQTDVIYFASGTTAVASMAVATNKWALVSTMTDGILLPAGITALHFITAANAPVFVIVPEIFIAGNY